MKHKQRILVADDSKFNRTIIRETLIQLDMSVTECVDGEEALLEIKTHPFDLIITDTVMPKKDGINLIKEIKQSKTVDYIPVILMTGNDDVNAKIVGLSIGADDFIQKPINQNELAARVLSLLRLKRMHDLLYEKNRLMESELESAKKIQRFIIPDNFDFISYPKIQGIYQPMEEIGGDFYDAYKLPDGRIGLLIADVTGHGVPAALIVTMIKMIFNIYAPQYKSTKKLFTLINSKVKDLLISGQYLTAFYAIYDPEKKSLSFSNAGHVLPLLYKKERNKVYEIDTEKGFFIGIVDEPDYDQKAVKIDPGDRLLLFTDGLSEIKNRSKEDFGETRIIEFMKENNEMEGKEFCTELYERVMKFGRRSIRNDDIAFLYIEF